MIKMLALVSSLLVGMVQASDPRLAAAAADVSADTDTVEGYKADLLRQMRGAFEEKGSYFWADKRAQDFGAKLGAGLVYEESGSDSVGSSALCSSKELTDAGDYSPRALAAESVALSGVLAFELAKKSVEAGVLESRYVRDKKFYESKCSKLSERLEEEQGLRAQADLDLAKSLAEISYLRTRVRSMEMRLRLAKE